MAKIRLLISYMISRKHKLKYTDREHVKMCSKTLAPNDI